jgi:hypothetical protein
MNKIYLTAFEGLRQEKILPLLMRDDPEQTDNIFELDILIRPPDKVVTLATLDFRLSQNRCMDSTTLFS